MKYKILFSVLLILALAIGVYFPASAAPAPLRISFQRGATSGVVSQSLPAGKTQDYLLRAAANQIMQVSLIPNTPGQFAVWGANGVQLKPFDNNLGWQGVLPWTGDNRLRVKSPDASVTLGYCLRATVYARIQFAYGATSATRTSPEMRCNTNSTEQVGGYLLSAQAGQTMKVQIDSPNHNTFMTIMGSNGQVLQDYSSRNPVWQGTLPASQDYFLLPVATGPDSQFTFTVTISALGGYTPPTTRIKFAPGAESAYVPVSLAPGTTASYVLWAGYGQRMEVSIWPLDGIQPAGLSITITSPYGYYTWKFPESGVIDPLPMSGNYTITLTQPTGSSKPSTMYIYIPAS